MTDVWLQKKGGATRRDLDSDWPAATRGGETLTLTFKLSSISYSSALPDTPSIKYTVANLKPTVMQYVAIKIVLLPIIVGNRKYKIVENGNSTHVDGQVELVFLVQIPQSCLSY